MELPVALFIPNLLGYLRIILAVIGLHLSYTNPGVAVMTWSVSNLLDFLDGILARLLSQTSSYGVLLDVAADNILRTSIWIAVVLAASTSGNPQSASVYGIVACFIICVEWCTMVSTQVHAAQSDRHWKEARQHDPWIVQMFFQNNFRNPIGALGIYGLFAANLLAYMSFHPILYERIPAFEIFMYTAFAGRVLSATIELRFCYLYLAFVLENDAMARQQRQKSTIENRKIE
jgi:phosphatidylglycerophosphate synthase